MNLGTTAYCESLKRDLVFVLIVTATVSLSIHVAFAALNIFLVGRRTLVERRTSSL
jgi:hypothetical protein